VSMFFLPFFPPLPLPELIAFLSLEGAGDILRGVTPPSHDIQKAGSALLRPGTIARTLSPSFFSSTE